MSHKTPARKLLAASSALLALAGPALAADLRVPPPPPPPPVFTWTGFYLGGQIGYGWGDNSGSLAFATPFGLAGDPVFATPLGISGAGALRGDAQGVIGGAHVGYNLQINNFVIGVEGSVDGTTLSRTALSGFAYPADPNLIAAATATSTIRSSIQGSIRARAGFVLDRLLVYGTGGAAFGGFTSELQLTGAHPVPTNDPNNPFVAENFGARGARSSTRVGWTAGGGVQYAINNNWSIMAEYRYSDFGRIRTAQAGAFSGLSLSDNRRLAQNQVQVGFSYKFDTPAPAPLVAKY